MGTATALIPVKTLRLAKQRLASTLSVEQRATLMFELFRHVIATVYASQVFDRVCVVSADPQILSHAQSLGASIYDEGCAQGHNQAATLAAQHELQQGATAILTLCADLPLITPTDLLHLLQISHETPLVLAPGNDGTTTNALFIRPPLLIPYLFGAHSLQRYQQYASTAQIPSTLYHSAGLSFDLDTPADLAYYYSRSISS